MDNWDNNSLEKIDENKHLSALNRIQDIEILDQQIKDLKSEKILVKQLKVYNPLKARRDRNLSTINGQKLFKFRHFPPAIKEWKNSVYSYNKQYLKKIGVIHKMVTRTIRAHFNLSSGNLKPRSKRMRSLRRKLSTMRIFTNIPDIKQTNDKAIISLTIFNREKTRLFKKLYYYNRRRQIQKILIDKTNRYWFDRLSTKDQHIITESGTEPRINLVRNFKISRRYKWLNLMKLNKIKFDILKKISVTEEKLYGPLNPLYYLKRQNELISMFNVITKWNFKESAHTAHYGDNSEDKYLINETRVKRYKRRGKNLFKKRTKRVKKPFYVRKKMKHFVPELPRLTRRLRSKLRKRKLPYRGIKFKNELNFLSSKLLLKNQKLAYVRKLFYYYFLKYALSIFNVKVFAFKESNVPSKEIIDNIIDYDVLLDVEKKIKIQRKGKRNKKSKFTYKLDKTSASLYRVPVSLTAEGNKVKIYFYILRKKKSLIRKMINTRTNKDINNYLKIDKPIIFNVDLLDNSENDLDSILSNVNFVISQFLNKIIDKSNILEKNNTLKYMYKSFSKQHYLKYLSKIWKKQALFSSNYTKYMINKFKFNEFLPKLKWLVSIYYGKPVEFNFINLKNPHLNTDIYTDLIALKARKKAITRVMKKAISLAKKPKGYVDRTQMYVDYDLNKLNRFSLYNSMKFENLNKETQLYSNSLQQVLHIMYPRSLVNNITKPTNYKHEKKVFTSKLNNILNIVKYKTLSGVRIEAAGRLTRRYKAAKSLFKLKLRGNFQDTDFSKKVEFRKTSMPTVMLRKQTKANSQYSLNVKKRRIGSFGIKGWISGY